MNRLMDDFSNDEKNISPPLNQNAIDVVITETEKGSDTSNDENASVRTSSDDQVDLENVQTKNNVSLSQQQLQQEVDNDEQHSSSHVTTSSSSHIGDNINDNNVMTSIRSFSTQMSQGAHNVLLQRTRVGAAAFLVRDAVLYDWESPAQGAYNPYQFHNTGNNDNNNTTNNINKISIICRRLCDYRPSYILLHGSVWILIALTFFEAPHWCRPSNESPYHRYDTGINIQNNPREEGCWSLMNIRGIPAGNTAPFAEELYYPNAMPFHLTMTQSTIVESVAIFILCIFITLRIGRDGMSIQRYFRKGPAQYNRITQVVCILVLVCGLISGFTFIQPYARMAILISFAPVTQQNLRILVHMIPEIFNIMLVLAVVFIFYAWFGTVLFFDSPEHSEFSNFQEALWTLWITVTTVNYPDVMMPAYNENRWTAFYFISFMLISYFFLMNVILASVVNNYNASLEVKRQKRSDMAKNNLREAFRLMDYENRGYIDRDTFMALFVVLNEDFPDLRRWSDEDTKLLFAVLDRDGSAIIEEDEFLDFDSIAWLEFIRQDHYESIMKYWPKVNNSKQWQQFSRWVTSSYFEHMINVILLLNAVVIAIRTYPELSGQDVPEGTEYWTGPMKLFLEVMEILFTFLYVSEVIVKILVMGWSRYSESKRNLFDFIVTIMAVLSIILEYGTPVKKNNRVIRVVLMARILRLTRLLMANKRFHLIGMVSAQILPASVPVFGVLFLFMYFFAVLGMQLFGGYITRDPENQKAFLILGTDFSNNHYWANNFNDMFSGLNVIFDLLVVNNWYLLEEGFQAVTDTKWVRVYFFTFHIFGVVLVNNLVIAFVIDAFLSQLAVLREIHAAETVNGGVVLANRRAMFNGASVTGTHTSLRDEYVAQLRRKDSEFDIGQHERLKKLFTMAESTDEKQERGIAQ